ncbi:MAG: hypothetical protein IAE78_30665 [Myxococcus sp.]|nr:hypothetical protein [Myxococcus sp.]
MRAWLVLGLSMCSGCSCSEKKHEPVVTPPPVPVAREQAPVAPPRVSATWLQQKLTPTQMELAARLEYGPSASSITVQLELPPGLQVTRGRTYFTLAPTSEPKSHVESLSLVSQALPVGDLVMVVTAPGLTVREPYRFGRPGPPPPAP